jgi:hypothetical protein
VHLEQPEQLALAIKEFFLHAESESECVRPVEDGSNGR